MRSTLVVPKRRSCPLCGHTGFARTAVDYFRRPQFECNACRHVWVTERGPGRGTGRDRNATKDSSNDQ